jgi:hypothetical protein
MLHPSLRDLIPFQTKVYAILLPSACRKHEPVEINTTCKAILSAKLIALKLCHNAAPDRQTGGHALSVSSGGSPIS